MTKSPPSKSPNAGKTILDVRDPEFAAKLKTAAGFVPVSRPISSALTSISEEAFAQWVGEFRHFLQRAVAYADERGRVTRLKFQLSNEGETKCADIRLTLTLPQGFKVGTRDDF